MGKKQLPHGQKDSEGLFHSEDKDRHFTRSDTAKVSVSLSLPDFNCTKGCAGKWVRDVLSIVKTQRYDESQWDALLPTYLKKVALNFFNTKRKLFSNYTQY